jgi:hypothetical protein
VQQSLLENLQNNDQLEEISNSAKYNIWKKMFQPVQDKNSESTSNFIQENTIKLIYNNGCHHSTAPPCWKKANIWIQKNIGRYNTYHGGKTRANGK